MKVSAIRARLNAPKRRNFWDDNLPEETAKWIEENRREVDSWRNWGYSTYDTYCSHCGSMVLYNRAMLGQGTECCWACHPEEWENYWDGSLNECPHCDEERNDAVRAFNARRAAGQPAIKIWMPGWLAANTAEQP